MNKQIVKLFVIKNKWGMKLLKEMEGKWMHMTKWKKTLQKICILYDSNSTTFWKRKKFWDSAKIIGYQGYESGNGWIGKSQKLF